MKLYLLTQTANRGYDTFNACVVAAITPRAAKNISVKALGVDCWAPVGDIAVQYLGEAKRATRQGIVLTSFLAG